jgi:hypothetical protein
MRVLLGLICVVGFVSGANAQLLVGNDDATAPVAANAWSMNLAAGTSTVLWGDANPEVNGMAADPATNTVYVTDVADLYAGPIGVGQHPPLVGQTQVAGTNISFQGLAWARGTLYGSSVSSTAGPEGIYSINLSTLEATLAFAFDPSGDYIVGGLAYNPADGLFYGTNDDSTPARGLYSFDVFGTGGASLVTAYPGTESDIDGLTIGNGIAYLVEDEAGDTIHPYDLVAGVYLPDITSPMTSSEVFCGGAWVPEPSTLVLLAVGGLALIRRR